MNNQKLKEKEVVTVTNGVYYECGSCKFKVLIEKQDPICCKECGYRILYKLRSKRPSEYLAR